LRFTELEQLQIAAVRKELEQEYEAPITPLARSSQPRVSIRALTVILQYQVKTPDMAIRIITEQTKVRQLLLLRDQSVWHKQQ